MDFFGYKIRLLILAPALIIALFCTRSANAESIIGGRKAFVLGNAKYNNNPLPPLNSPIKDADDISIALESMGFSVTNKSDLGKRQMDLEIEKFANTIKDNDIVLFYYSGHGTEENGVNYLLPIDFKGTDIKTNGYALVNKLNNMSKKKKAIVILDSCRTESMRPISSKEFEAIANNMYVAFATSLHQPSYDGMKGESSAFTKAFLRELYLNRFACPRPNIHDLLEMVSKKMGSILGQERQMPVTICRNCGAFSFYNFSSDCKASDNPWTDSNLPEWTYAYVLLGVFKERAVVG